MLRSKKSKKLVISLVLLTAFNIGNCAENEDDFVFTIPDNELDTVIASYVSQLGLEPIEAPDQANMNPSLFDLGEMLFNEPLLSGNENIACSTCHMPDNYTIDQLSLPIGEGGTGLGVERTLDEGHLISRNSPALFNVSNPLYNKLFTDGSVRRSEDGSEIITPSNFLSKRKSKAANKIVDALDDNLLAYQALFPLLDRLEMRGQKGENKLANLRDNRHKRIWKLIAQRISNNADYWQPIESAFPGLELSDLNIGHIGRAIAEYQTYKFTATNTRYDQYLKGNLDALSNNEKRGLIVFSDVSRANCVSCHGGQLLSDMQFHNILTPQIGPGKDENQDDLGLGYLEENRNYRFKTPMLRNIALTAPYMHDGAFQTLDDVLEHYRTPRESLNNYADYYTGLTQQFDNLFIETEHNDERFSSVSEMIFNKGGLGGDNAGPGIKMTDAEKQVLLEFLLTSLTSQL